MQQFGSVKHSADSAGGQVSLVTPYAGRQLMSHVPSWVMPDSPADEVQAAHKMIAAVSWFKYKGLNCDMYSCPVLSSQQAV